jgi:hypothetical protein
MSGFALIGTYPYLSRVLSVCCFGQISFQSTVIVQSLDFLCRGTAQGGNLMAAPIDPSLLSWREPHRRALDEVDKTKLAEHVHLVEGALFRRWQQLSGSDDHHEERREMDLAGQDLLRMKTEKLGWPSIKS